MLHTVLYIERKNIKNINHVESFWFLNECMSLTTKPLFSLFISTVLIPSFICSETIALENVIYNQCHENILKSVLYYAALPISIARRAQLNHKLSLAETFSKFLTTG